MIQTVRRADPTKIIIELVAPLLRSPSWICNCDDDESFRQWASALRLGLLKELLTIQPTVFKIQIAENILTRMMIDWLYPDKLAFVDDIILEDANLLTEIDVYSGILELKELQMTKTVIYPVFRVVDVVYKSDVDVDVDVVEEAEIPVVQPVKLRLKRLIAREKVFEAQRVLTEMQQKYETLRTNFEARYGVAALAESDDDGD